MRKPRRLTAEELAPFSWNLPRPDAPPQGLIDWTVLYGNASPVEIEVGMGKGKFLLSSAQARPSVNFFGIEIVRKYQLYATTRYAIRNLTNVRTACADAKVILEKYVAPASVAAIHVYFPDPWWKQRHRKRRVFTAEFAALAARAIQIGGWLHIATDVPEYFEVMTAIVRPMPEFREQSTVDTQAAEYVTNFERKALLKGVAINRTRFVRQATPA